MTSFSRSAACNFLQSPKFTSFARRRVKHDGGAMKNWCVVTLLLVLSTAGCKSSACKAFNDSLNDQAAWAPIRFESGKDLPPLIDAATKLENRFGAVKGIEQDEWVSLLKQSLHEVVSAAVQLQKVLATPEEDRYEDHLLRMLSNLKSSKGGTFEHCH